MPKKPPQRESYIQAACIAVLNAYRFHVLRINSGMIQVQGKNRSRKIRLAPAGTSDLICCSPTGQFWAIEIKRPGNKPTFHQQRFLDEIAASGGVALWTDSSEELEEFIKEQLQK